MDESDFPACHPVDRRLTLLFTCAQGAVNFGAMEPCWGWNAIPSYVGILSETVIFMDTVVKQPGINGK